MNKTDLRKAFSETLFQMAEENDKIYAVTSDARNSSTIAAFSKTYPDRFVECGIAEQNELGVAAGLTLVGKIPFVCAPAAFLSARAVEQIKTDLSYSEKNVNLVGVSGGMAYGESGMTHYSINDVAVLRSFFGLHVFVPCDGYQVRALTRLLADTPQPSYMRLGRSEFPDVYQGNEEIAIGKAVTLTEGCDLTIIACGKMVYPALQAARALKEAGISARVLDMFCLSPLDEDAIVQAAKQTGRILTVEEHVRAGGLGEAVAAVVCAHCPVPMDLMTLPSEHLITGSEDQINDYYHLNAEGIFQHAKNLLG